MTGLHENFRGQDENTIEARDHVGLDGMADWENIFCKEYDVYMKGSGIFESRGREAGGEIPAERQT